MNGRVKVTKLGIVLAPTRHAFEQRAVLNPACYQDGEYVHMFYRAIDENMMSSIGYARLKGPTKVVERWDKPILYREHAYEKNGIEDPRIVKLGNTFYMTYVVHDGKNALIAYAVSRDLKHFQKKGVISPHITYDEAARFFREQRLKDRYFMFEAYYEEFAGKDVLLWDKDALLFPKKFNGKFALVHRILPDMHIVYFKTFAELKKKSFWKKYLEHLPKYVMLENKFWYESRNIGGGAPPIELKSGWLLIYHGVEELNRSRVYHAAAALFDKRDPTKVHGRLDDPLFSPEKKWEKRGFVDNVVFPTGTAIFGKYLYVYYGAADNSIAVAKMRLDELERKLHKNHSHSI